MDLLNKNVDILNKNINLLNEEAVQVCKDTKQIKFRLVSDSFSRNHSLFNLSLLRFCAHYPSSWKWWIRDWCKISLTFTFVRHFSSSIITSKMNLRRRKYRKEKRRLFRCFTEHFLFLFFCFRKTRRKAKRTSNSPWSFQWKSWSDCSSNDQFDSIDLFTFLFSSVHQCIFLLMPKSWKSSISLLSHFIFLFDLFSSIFNIFSLCLSFVVLLDIVEKKRRSENE